MRQKVLGAGRGVSVLVFTALLLIFTSCNTTTSQEKSPADLRSDLVMSPQESRAFWQQKVSEFSELLAGSDWWIEARTVNPQGMVPSHISGSKFPIDDPELARQVSENYIQMRKRLETKQQPVLGPWYQLYPHWPERLYTDKETFLVYGGKLYIDSDRDGSAELTLEVAGSPYDYVPVFVRRVGRYPADALDMLSRLYNDRKFLKLSDQAIFSIVAAYLNPYTGKLREIYTEAAEPADPQPGDIFMHRYTASEIEAINSTPGVVSSAESQPSNLWYYKLYGWDGLILDLRPYIEYAEGPPR